MACKQKMNQPEKIEARKNIEIKKQSSPQSSTAATHGEVTASTNAKDHEAKTRCSYAEKKPVNSENGVQAGKPTAHRPSGNAHSGKQKHVRKHQSPKKGSYAARRGHVSKARRTNTINTLSDGGSLPSARSNAWNKAPQKEKNVYDPLYGRHAIPRVDNPQLLEAIVANENLTEVIRKLRKHPKKATGVDKKTVREVCDTLLNDPLQMEALQQDIMSGNYWPSVVRRSYIPKKNGKLRALGIAIVKDRIVMSAILKAIETALPPDTWNPNSFAYTVKRSTKDAIARVDKIRKEGYTWAVCLDLKGFFDNVPHDRLMAKVSTLILDERVVELMNRFLTAVVWDEKTNTKARNRIGTIQGSAISPLLASKIYLDELDQEMDYRNHCFVRYADDVTVFCKSRESAKRIRVNIMKFIEGTLHCPVNEEKTCIVGIKDLALLGVYLKGGKWHIKREKLLEARAAFASGVRKAKRTTNDYDLKKAIDSMLGFLNQYRKISPSLAKEVRTNRCWCRKVCQEILGHDLESHKLLSMQFARL